jgi:hypothetical protein
VLAQGIADVPRELQEYWAYTGHKALIDGLPDVARAIDDLERGAAPVEAPVDHGTYPMCRHASLSAEITRRTRRRPATATR